LMSLLLKEVESFLIHEQTAQQSEYLQLQLSEVYRLRNLPKHFKSNQQKLREAQEQSPIRNAEYWLQEHQFQQTEYAFESGQRRTGQLNLQAVSDSLDVYYLAAKLRCVCVAISHQAVYKTEYDFGLLETVLHEVKQKNYLQHPAILVYHAYYLAITENTTDAYFQHFVQYIQEYENMFPHKERRDLFLLAINYCIRKFNEGATHYVVQEFELFRHALQHGYLLNNGVLSRFTFRNIVSTGIYIKDYDWVEKFIQAYANQLEEAHRESTYSFSLARLYYERRFFDKALTLLQMADYGDILLALAAKTIALKIYYELSEFDLLMSHLDAMKIFILRKKIMGYHRTNYLNLIRYTYKLLEMNNIDKLKKLKNTVEAANNIAEKDWLLLQFNTLL
ncbi:MAG: hypothetical protein KA974_08920, partial [Saprospiraceae bacterium]|nr:hypothetical protein [Saprospiraceae bacterium]